MAKESAQTKRELDMEDDGELLTERLIFPVSKSMRDQINDYRFSSRTDSKAAAIRKLIAAGLKAENQRVKRK